MAFYEKSIFRACLPELLMATDNATRQHVSRSGYAFPPFMVLDRGITLAEWSKSERSHSAVLSMAAEVLRLLELLHRAGSVHRDIKPANLLLIMHTQHWRLLDFGIAAPAGAPPLRPYDAVDLDVLPQPHMGQK